MHLVPQLSFPVRGYHPLWPDFPFRSSKSSAKEHRLFRFRSPLLSESRLMSFPRATEMFQFTRFASHTYEFSMRYPEGWVSPFRNLRIKANLPAPRSLSQAITSFVAYHCQGIHHMLLFAWPYNFDLSKLSSRNDVWSFTRRVTPYLSINRFNSKLKVSFDAIKKLLCCQQPRKARTALNLYECTVSLRSLTLATLI